jgi:hypothetical protein
MSDEHENEKEALAILQERKWSTSKFFIGIAKIIFNLSTIAWGIYTYFVQVILLKVFAATNSVPVSVQGTTSAVMSSGDLDSYLKSPVMIILVSGWVVITFVTACNLQKAFSTMISNAKILAEIKARLELKGIADIAQTAGALRK